MHQIVKKNFKNIGSCYSSDALKKMAISYNKLNPHDPIMVDVAPMKLWNQIKSKVKNCSNEWCWLDQDFVKKIHDENIKKYTFKPKIPRGKDTWLSTSDINKVMEQFEKVDPSFIFLGAVPIDFETAPFYKESFAKLLLNDLESKGINKIGIVFNMDPHYKSGSHWAAAFIDSSLREFQYFDSLGKKPHKRVRKWFTNLNKYEDPKYYLVWNDSQHQLENNECGVYSLNFIIHRLLGVPFKKIVANVIRDTRMNKQRKIIFLPNQY